MAEQYFQPKLDLIQHLIQYSQNVLLVTAPANRGKTAFVHFCLERLTPQLKKHLLVITPNLSIETMMESIAKGFGMSWPQQGSLPSDSVQKIWTLFVDDAHLLSLEMLETLVRLVNFHQDPRRQLHLVLLGTDKLVAQFSANRITNLVGSYFTVIELGLPANCPLSSTHLFTQPVLIKTEAVALPQDASPKIFEPLEPNRVAKNYNFEESSDIDLLDEAPDAWPEVMPNKTPHLFSRPMAYGLCLGVFVGVGLWFWKGNDATSSPQFIASSDDIIVQEAISMPEVLPPAAPEQSFTTEQVAEQVAEQVIAQTIPEPPEIMVPVKPILKAKVVKQAKRANNKIVLAKNKSHYTLQLYGSNEPQKVKHFKQAHGLNDAWIVSKKHQGQVWHVLLMGDYSSKKQAEKATEHLPNSVYHAKIKPWVRDFASLQSELVDPVKGG